VCDILCQACDLRRNELSKMVAARVESAGVAKAALPARQLLALAVLAGAFIGVGAAAYTMVMTGTAPGFGPARLLGGVVFSLGLILVIVGGAGSLRSALDSDWQLDEHSLSRAPTRRCRILARSSVGLAATTTRTISSTVAPDYRNASTGSRPTWTPSSSGLVHAA